MAACPDCPEASPPSAPNAPGAPDVTAGPDTNLANGGRGAALYTRPFVALLLVQLAFGFTFSTFYLLPKFMTTELRSPPSAIGAVMAMFGLSAFVAIPLVGACLDRLGSRASMAAGAALMSATAFAFLLVEHAGVFACALRLLQGVAWSMVFSVGLALASEMAPEARLGEAIGIVGGASLIMNAGAPAVVEPLAARVGYAPVFVLAGLMSAIAAVAALRVPAPATPRTRGRGSLLGVMARPRGWMMAPILGVSGLVFGVMFTFHQPFALSIGVGAVRGFLMAYTAGAIGVRLGLGRLADRVGRRPVAAAALLLYGASAFGMEGLTASRLALLGGLFGVAHGFFFPAFNALVLASSRPGERGLAMTLSNGFFSIGTACVLGLGVVVERFGYPAVFRAAGLSSLAGVALLVAWRPAPARDAARDLDG